MSGFPTGGVSGGTLVNTWNKKNKIKSKYARSLVKKIKNDHLSKILGRNYRSFSVIALHTSANTFINPQLARSLSFPALTS